MFTKCCSARISVGAMNATCRPFSIATSAASSATIVLPAPTSPCSSRFIGCGRCRSSTISLSAVRCPGVSLNGSTWRADSRMRSSTDDRHRLALGCRRPAAGHHPHLKQKRLLEDQPPLRRRGEPVQLLERTCRPAGNVPPAAPRIVPAAVPQPQRLGQGIRQIRPAGAAASRRRSSAASSA